MVMRWRYRVLVCLLAVSPIRAARAQASADTLPTDVTQAVLAEGKSLFGGEGLCAACHGVDAKGALGPDLTDQTWLHGTGKFSEIVARVLAGVTSDESKLGQIMPPRGGAGITDQQIRAVSAYVWSLSHPSRRK